MGLFILIILLIVQLAFFLGGWDENPDKEGT